MARRRTGPWLRKQDNCYYTTINRTAVKLGSADEPWEKIEQRYAEELAKTEKPSRWTVVALVDRFLEHSKRKNSPDTYEWYKGRLDSFKASIDSRLKVTALDPDTVTQWVEACFGTCSDSTRANAIRCVVRVMNWGLKTRKIKFNPILGIERPTPEGREVVIDFDQFIELLTHVKDKQFQDVLTFLWLTGCRPQEFRVIEARHISGKVITLDRRQSKGKKYRRKIWLNTEAHEIVARLSRQNQIGPIFRNTKGKPWRRNQLASRFYRLREKMNIDGLCAYTLRHSYATRMLKAGVDSVKLGILMGHKDPSMVARIYQHLTKDDEHMLSVAGSSGSVA
jgi:integrase